MVALLVSQEWSVAGPSDGLPIILVHASGMTRDMWLPQMETLSDEFHVIAPDLPGHGTHDHERFSLDGALDVIRRAITEEAKGPALLVGISLGGFLVNAFAGRWPQLTTGLVLVGSSVSFRSHLGPLTWLSAGIYDFLATHLPHHAIQAIADARAKRLTRNMRQQLPPRYAEPLIGRGFFFRDWGKSLLEIVGVNLRGILGTYDAPVLILCGETDKYNRRYDEDQLNATRYGTLHVLHDGAHLCNLSNPDEFTNEVRDFAHTLDWPQRHTPQQHPAIPSLR